MFGLVWPYMALHGFTAMRNSVPSHYIEVERVWRMLCRDDVKSSEPWPWEAVTHNPVVIVQGATGCGDWADNGYAWPIDRIRDELIMAD